MAIRCHLFGHRRSASRAAFDDKQQRWFSDCKRCHVLLVREPDGKWRPAPLPPRKLETIRRAKEETSEPAPVPEPSQLQALAAS